MKALKHTLTIFLLLFFTATFGQRPHHQTKDKEEAIKTLRVGIYTNVLNLTSKEAEKFWPVFNEFNNKVKEIRNVEGKEKRQLMMNSSDLTDKEIESALERLFGYEQKALDLKIEYSEKFKKILPIKKVVLMQKAEMQFKGTLLDKFRENPPPPRGRDF